MHDIAQKQIFFKKLSELDPDPDLVLKFPDPAKRSGSATLDNLQRKPHIVGGCRSRKAQKLASFSLTLNLVKETERFPTSQGFCSCLCCTLTCTRPFTPVAKIICTQGPAFVPLSYCRLRLVPDVDTSVPCRFD